MNIRTDKITLTVFIFYKSVVLSNKPKTPPIINIKIERKTTIAAITRGINCTKNNHTIPIARDMSKPSNTLSIKDKKFHFC